LSVRAAIAALPICDHTLIGGETEPGEARKNVGFKLLGGARRIGVFDAYDVGAAMSTCEE
jgi:hypothetical protein